MAEFLSTPSARRATEQLDAEYQAAKFLSTPSARRATGADSDELEQLTKFLSTPSARRATMALRLSSGRMRKISIHALREEGDFSAVRVAILSCVFLSTPSARRATMLREHDKDREPISIHALREEGDDYYDGNDTLQRRFLSTPSARRATAGAAGCGAVSINFYPRPPRGGRLNGAACLVNAVRFLSTPSARRATRVRAQGLRRAVISIHALREEGDLRHL